MIAYKTDRRNWSHCKKLGRKSVSAAEEHRRKRKRKRKRAQQDEEEMQPDPDHQKLQTLMERPEWRARELESKWGWSRDWSWKDWASSGTWGSWDWQESRGGWQSCPSGTARPELYQAVSSNSRRSYAGQSSSSSQDLPWSVNCRIIYRSPMRCS